MAERPFKRMKQGPLEGQLSAAELNRQQQAIERASRAAAAGLIGSDAEIAGGFFSGDPESITIRILSGNNPYAWEQVQRIPGATANDPETWEALTNTGTTTDLPAYEADNNVNVPAGTIVRAWPDNVNGRYWFVFSPDGENLLLSGSGSGPGCLRLTSTGQIIVDQTVVDTVVMSEVLALDLQLSPQCLLTSSLAYRPIQLGLNSCGIVVQVVRGTKAILSRTVDLCPCDCGGTGSGSCSGSVLRGSGSGSPTGCMTVCSCRHCPDGAPCKWLLTYPGGGWGNGPTTTCTMFNGIVALNWDFGCYWNRSFDQLHWVELAYDAL